LKEATAVVAPLLGELYQYDSRPFWKTYWETSSTCHYGMETKNKGVHGYPKKVIKNGGVHGQPKIEE